MRRSAVILCTAILAIMALLTGCNKASKPHSQATSTGSAQQDSTSSTIPQATSQAASKIDPCQLVMSSDLSKIFGATSVARISEDSPVTGEFNERSCGYTITMPGARSTTLTVLVTTHEDNNNGEAWTAEKEGSQLAAQADGTFRSVPNIGDGAFFSDTGWLTAHKDSVIIEVKGIDDVDFILNDSRAVAIIQGALARI